MSLTLYHPDAIGLKLYFHGTGRGQCLHWKGSTFKPALLILGGLLKRWETIFLLYPDQPWEVQYKKLTSTSKAFSMDEIFRYRTLHININAWLFSGYSLYVSLSPCLNASLQDLLGRTELKGLKNSGGHCVHQGYCVCHNVIPFGIMPRCFAALFSVSHRLVAPWKNVNFTLSHSYLTRCDISCEAGQAVWRDHRRGHLVEHFSGTEFPCSSNCSSRRGSQALSCMSWLWWFSHIQK